MNENVKTTRARMMRYKRPMLASLGYETIMSELYDINEACSDVHWFFSGDGSESLLNALDGDEEAEYEFQMAFSDLEAKAEQLFSAITEWDIKDEFDDCTVALIGNRYRTLGYDAEEEDYFALTGYEQGLAHTESGKRLMRHTKPEMISAIGQCLGMLIAFMDLRQSYDYLKATFDILRDENTSLLQTIREISNTYEKANEVNFYEWDEETKKLDRLLHSLPTRVWLE